MKLATLRKEINHAAGRMLLPLFLLFAPSHLPAQQVTAEPEQVTAKPEGADKTPFVPTGRETEPDEGDVVVLSPFEVTSSSNVGYQANNTLAGTRIRSDLKDIANSVQVITKEFLEDVGATDISEILVYTTSTEAYGVSGNASFIETDNGDVNQERARREPHLQTRVRGLARADLARDYFLSDIEFHPYITGEVSINRGPNASLFGLGSPGGIINAAIDKANTSRTSGQFDLRLEEYGSVAASINHNQVLIKDVLAVRVAVLDSDARYEQKQAYMDQERYFAAITLRPMKGTAIRANYERGESYGSLPILTPPTDATTTWFESGKPSYDPYRNQWFVNGAQVTNAAHIKALAGATAPLFQSNIPLFGGPVAVYDDPSSSVMGARYGYGALQTGLRKNAPGRTSTTMPVPLNTDAVMRKWKTPSRNLLSDANFIAGAIPGLASSEAAFYFSPVVTDRSIYDYREQSILGPAPLQRQEFEVYSVTLEQTFFDNNLGFEAAYFDQHWAAYLAEAKGFEITPDINLTLIDGSPNPNYGRPYAGSRGYSQGEVRDREAYQVVAFAKYDFGKKHENWLRHLGNHSLTGSYNNQKRTNTAPNVWYARADSSWAVGTAANLTEAQNFASSTRIQPNTRAHVMQYVGEPIHELNSFSEARLTPVTALQVPDSAAKALKWNPFTGQWQVGAADFSTAINDFEDMWGFGNNVDTSDVESYSGVLQSHFLGGHLVTTVSRRTDEVQLADGVGPQNPATGFYIPLVPEATDFQEPRSQVTNSYGIVAHVPSRWLPDWIGLSAHYVNSQNFSAGDTGVDIFNRPGPLTTGTTEEYGFALAALDGRFYFRVNFFETASENEVITNNKVQIGNDLKTVMENNSPAELAAAGWDLDTLFQPGFLEAIDFRPTNPNVPNNETTWVYTNINGTNTNQYRDTLTEGVEMEVSYSPTTNWRMALNVSSAEVGVSNALKISKVEMTRIANEIFADPRMGQLWITADRSNELSNQGRLVSRSDNVLADIARQTAAEGGPLPEVVKWRWNLVTNYSFSKDSPLKGIGIGAGIRWQDKPFIGAQLKQIDGVFVPDYNKQWYGNTDVNVDTWATYSRKLTDGINMRLEMRVRGINKGSGELIPTRANPDGEVAAWRIGQPMSLEFSARLTF